MKTYASGTLRYLHDALAASRSAELVAESGANTLESVGDPIDAELIPVTRECCWRWRVFNEKLVELLNSPEAQALEHACQKLEPVLADVKQARVDKKAGTPAGPKVVPLHKPEV